MTPAEARELIEDLEAEINNGGFDQFFFNSAGDHTKETVAALQAVGAVHTASVVAAAASRFPGGMPPVQRDSRQEILEKISPEGDAFETEDEAFLEYKDDLAVLVDEYAG